MTVTDRVTSGDTSATHAPVYLFADDVGMSCVTSCLLDHVDEDPSQVQFRILRLRAGTIEGLPEDDVFVSPDRGPVLPDMLGDRPSFVQWSFRDR